MEKNPNYIRIFLRWGGHFISTYEDATLCEINTLFGF
jgi:hypothetical protein